MKAITTNLVLLATMAASIGEGTGKPCKPPVPTGKSRPDRNDPAKIEAAERRRLVKAEKRRRQYVNSLGVWHD